MLDQAPNEQAIAKQAAAMNQPLPDKIQNAPQLRLGLQLYIEAFFDLDSERINTFSVGLIPFNSILQYARFFDFDEEATGNLVFLVSQMDRAHVKRINDGGPK